ncbi:MAG TPA: branched-chain amino acid aminotransferase [Microscillaceae bacterium]|nr:branched-chain amino acid aminotransferase [Microscillaceae bacterium]
MQIQSYFKQAKHFIHHQDFSKLKNLRLEKPAHFNWVEEIFYAHNVQEFGEETALIWCYNEQEKKFSFKDIYNESSQFLNLLRKHGAKEGDRIYSLLPLIPANWVSFLATIKGGFVMMPTATNLTARDIQYRFETLFPEVFITDIANAEKIEEAEKAFGQKIKLKVCVGGRREGWIAFEDLAQESTQAEAAQTKADDPVLYFFTSGTTGLPKIVVHTHFTYPFGHLSTASWLGCRQGDVHYNISSPGWAKFAWSSFFAPWNMGATILANQVDKFVPSQQLETMQKYEVTSFCGSPTVLRMLIQEDFTAYNLKLRTSCAAGEPLNPDVIQKWKDAMGIEVRDGYGQTETTALVGNLLGQNLKPGSMGQSTFLYEVVICNEEGQEVPPLEEGVICVRTNTGVHNGIFLEYLNDTERTQKAFKHDLYYTGDKAYKDKEGNIWFIGRNDDVIKASAYRIGPFEVESILIEHDAVVESAVVASPHEMRGYAVKAFVMLKEGIKPSKALADELFAFAEQNLAKYKVPRVIEFPASLPKTISGKIRRVELRANEAQNKIDQVEVPHEYFHAKY